MKDEIKETLDKLLEYFKESNINDFGYEKDKLISYEEAQILLDYITNLQEEKDKYKNVIDKIKKKLNVLNEEPYNATTYIMVITEIYKLLEEVE